MTWFTNRIMLLIGSQFYIDTVFIHPPTEAPAQEHKDDACYKGPETTREYILKNNFTGPFEGVLAIADGNGAQGDVKQFGE